MHLTSLLAVILAGLSIGCRLRSSNVSKATEIVPRYLWLSAPLNHPDFAYAIDLNSDGPRLWQGKLSPNDNRDHFGGFDPDYIVVTKTTPEDLGKFFSATQFSPPVELSIVATAWGNPPFRASDLEYFSQLRAALDRNGLKYRIITNLHWAATIIIKGEIVVSE